MFIGREKELKTLTEELNSGRQSRILLYGKRRVGKTSLVLQAARSFEGRVIAFEAIRASLNENISRLSSAIAAVYGEEEIPFKSLRQAVGYLAAKGERVLLVIDEYPDLKYFEKSETVDSLLRELFGILPLNISIILTGSHIRMMKSLLEEDNPLFGRFTLVMKLEEFTYYEAAAFFPSLPPVEKIRVYSVFGGLPYILSMVDPALSLEENIRRLLIEENSNGRVYLEYVLQLELGSLKYGNTILNKLRNGAPRYSELEKKLGVDTKGALARHLQSLIDIGMIRKVAPINNPDDRKKTFYEISNNLVRFYYTYILPYSSSAALLAPDVFYENFISKSIDTFISYRFEDICTQYFRIRAGRGELPRLLNVGRYWYNDRIEKKSGEFDVVLQNTDGYDVYECKFYKNKLDRVLCDKEAQKIRAIRELKIGKIGIISASGFDFTSDEYELLDIDDLFL